MKLTEISYFHHLRFDRHCFNDVISLCRPLRFNGTDWRITLTADIHTTAVDGNKRLFAFSFADFLEIQLKFALHLD